MTSKSVADALVRDLRFHGAGPAADAAATTGGFAFALDFDSGEVWPDLPYDTSAPAARYDDETRARVLAILGEAAGTMAARAPIAFAFVNAQLERALLRRSERIAGASSASNRACVGLCVLTNLHRQDDAVQIAIEGLLHESIHQYLYRTELADGNFCDLAETLTFRSPWSGARLPLHSLVHACFVWFGLLTLWTELALAPISETEATRSRERIAHCLFGFAFLADVLESPPFPRASVDPLVLDCLREQAAAARRAAQAAEPSRTLRELSSLRQRASWPRGLAAALAPSAA